MKLRLSRARCRLGRLEAAIQDAASATNGATSGLAKGEASLFEISLVGLARAITDHALATRDLVVLGHMRSSVVLLRTVIELWFTARYVAADTTGARAAAYIMKAPRGAARYLKQLLKFITENPHEGGAALASAGLTSRQELDEHIARFEQELARAKANGVPEFPSVAECAKAVGLAVTYRSVYGQLFSEVVHGGAGDILGNGFNGPDAETKHKVLITEFFVQVDILSLISEHFGRPDPPTLAKFNAKLAALQR